MGVYILAAITFLVGGGMWLLGIDEGARTETIMQQIYARQFITGGAVIMSISFVIGAIGSLMEIVERKKAPKIDLTGLEKRLDEANDNLMMLKTSKR